MRKGLGGVFFNNSLLTGIKAEIDAMFGKKWQIWVPGRGRRVHFLATVNLESHTVSSKFPCSNICDSRRWSHTLQSCANVLFIPRTIWTHMLQEKEWKRLTWQCADYVTNAKIKVSRGGKKNKRYADLKLCLYYYPYPVGHSDYEYISFSTCPPVSAVCRRFRLVSGTG